jgi:hypothetical protein
VQKNRTISHDAHEFAEHEIRHAKWLIVVGEPFKQPAVFRMLGQSARCA